MAILRNVAKTDTLENQRQIVNLVAEDLYDYISGESSIAVLKTEYSNGTLASPSLTFQSDLTLGIYKDGSQRLGFASNGKPVVSLSPTGSYFAQNLYTEKRSLSTANIQITAGGSGYAQGVYPNIDVVGGTGVSAKSTITVNSSGSVSNVIITDGGYSYVIGDVLTVAPQGISNDPTGIVVGLNLITAGQTYVSGLDVPTTGGSGTGLTVDITASVNGVPEQIGFLNGTQGYTTSQNVFTTGGLGSNLTLDIVASTGGIIGTIGGFSGSNYFDGVYSPTGGNGTGASVSISVINAGEISQTSLTSAGSAYTTTSGANLTGGLGSGATVDIIAGAQNIVSAFTVDSVGSVYTPGTYTNQATAVVDPLSTGVGLTVNYVVDAGGTLSSITINSGGSGYVQGEFVSIPGSQAVDPDDGSPLPDDARLTISSVIPGGVISSAVINAGGLGYQVNDILSINGGTGGTITVTTVLGGIISGINIVNGGQNYQIGDVLIIPNGTGGQFSVSGLTGGAVTSAVINTPGSGYQVNDSITIGNGTATVVVTDISGGNITNIAINDPGTGYDINDVITVSGVSNVADKATCLIVDTSDGSGFIFTATGINITNPVKVEVLTGDVEAVSFTGSTALIDDISSDSVLSEILTVTTEVVTPKISAVNNLLVDVVNDITVNASTINITDGGPTQLSITPANGNLTTSGIVKTLGGINVNEITTIINGKIETLLDTPMVLKPSSGKILKIDSNRALIVPVGSQVQRPQLDAETGAIRFNTDTRQFEGYDGDINIWASLGSVRDTDGNTYLLAESTVGANDNTFYFYNNGTNTLNITENSLQFVGMDSISTTSGELKLQNSTLSVGGNLKLFSNKIETSLTGLTLKPATGTNVIVESSTSLVIPYGLSSERGSASTGSIRYNTSISQFEGYSGTNWSSLGGVRDVDGNTYIIPESSSGANENILYFYNNGFNSLQLDQNKLEFRSTDTISRIDLAGVLLWQPATSYVTNNLVYNGTSVYRITTNITSGNLATAPIHTTGTQNNYQYIRTIYGDLTFSNINNVNINSVLNVSNKLKITNSDISSVTEDITITPFTGKLVKVNSTTSFVLPVGTSLNRGIAESGAVRFNTATTQYEGYNGNAWTSLGGVRDVDGNTYIIPESSSGANENILYFYNDGDNTLRVTKTALTFQTANTITSNDNILNINVADVRYSSDTFCINSSSATITKLYSGKNNLDIGLKSGSTNDALLRLSATGDIYVNKTFTEGSYTGEKVLDRSLTYFGLSNVVIETNKFTLIKGTNNFNSYVLYDPDLAVSCKVTIVAVNLSTSQKHMVEYNVIANGANLYNLEYESLLSGNILYDAIFDFDSNGDVRITTTLDNSVLTDSNIEFTILKTIIR